MHIPCKGGGDACAQGAGVKHMSVLHGGLTHRFLVGIRSQDGEGSQVVGCHFPSLRVTSCVTLLFLPLS